MAREGLGNRGIKGEAGEKGGENIILVLGSRWLKGEVSSSSNYWNYPVFLLSFIPHVNMDIAVDLYRLLTYLVHK